MDNGDYMYCICTYWSQAKETSRRFSPLHIGRSLLIRPQIKYLSNLCLTNLTTPQKSVASHLDDHTQENEPISLRLPDSSYSGLR